MTRRKVAVNETSHPGDANSKKAEVVVPVIEEQIQVGKRTVESGRVRITKHIEQHEEVIDQPLLKEDVIVTRVHVNRPVDQAPPVRQEGDVTIIPVMEEVLVVERRLVLKEELHVRRKQEQVRQPQRVTVRKERAEVKRITSEAQQ
jgi:uncharacterized protein (TIGR02271 family)